MPQPEIERLSRASSEAQTKAAISACIAQEIRAGRERSQAIAMCHSMARDKTGGSPPTPGGGE